MITTNNDLLSNTVLGIDAWLESMRQTGGYGGPVAHRWQDNLLYAGPGIDWSYEGIIIGYLNLFKKTGDRQWLDKAIRAGMDIVNGQNEDGTYLASSFEINPLSGGTPHEAACDHALLCLADVLKTLGESEWEKFVQTAEDNLTKYYFNKLWDGDAGYFYNQTHDSSFVPNKVATTVEALFLLEKFSGDLGLVDKYIKPSLLKILACQVKDPESSYFGAIDQSDKNGQLSGRYFPYYIARCVHALVDASVYFEDDQFTKAALAAMNFVMHSQRSDGSFPQVVYANQHETLFPQWIAGVGDILTAANRLLPFGLNWPAMEKTEIWLHNGISPSGGIRTGHGFGILEGRRKALPDFRDILPVCHWVSNAFRYFTMCLPEKFITGSIETKETTCDCFYFGKRARFHETDQFIKVNQNLETVYLWRKPEPWVQKFLMY